MKQKALGAVVFFVGVAACKSTLDALDPDAGLGSEPDGGGAVDAGFEDAPKADATSDAIASIDAADAAKGPCGDASYAKSVASCEEDCLARPGFSAVCDDGGTCYVNSLSGGAPGPHPAVCPYGRPCVVDCAAPGSGGGKCDDGVVCRDAPCKVNCGTGPTAASACGRIDCGTSVKCEVLCQGITCLDVIDCSKSQDCVVNCIGSGRACTDKVLCGTGRCTVLCDGKACAMFDGGTALSPIVDCTTSKACDVTCTDGGCQGGVACPPGCELDSGLGCTSAKPGCDKCP